MKRRYFLIFMLVLFTFQGQAALLVSDRPIPTKEAISRMTEAEKKARLEEIKSRVEEIRDMDKSTLSASEKKALRAELKTLKKEAQATRGVYLSVGAIIIIILLLILIL